MRQKLGTITTIKFVVVANYYSREYLIIKIIIQRYKMVIETYERAHDPLLKKLFSQFNLLTK